MIKGETSSMSEEQAYLLQFNSSNVDLMMAQLTSFIKFVTHTLQDVPVYFKHWPTLCQIVISACSVRSPVKFRFIFRCWINKLNTFI